MLSKIGVVFALAVASSIAISTHRQTNHQKSQNGQEVQEENNGLPQELLDSWGGWRHGWRHPPHNQNLYLVYSDEHLAVYFDSQMSRSITWPFEPLSKAWKYIKETYGPFGPDPHLYLALHANKYAGCKVGAFITESFRPRNIIDCGSNSTLAWENQSAHYFEELLQSLASVIRLGVKGKYQYEDLEIARGYLDNLVVYDIYRHLRGDNDADLVRWKARALKESEVDRFYFRDWFLPLYDRFGGVSILNNYYTMAKRPWKITFMNWGEYVHCWCKAVGGDVTSLARAAFPWSTGPDTDFVEDLTQARKYIPFKYLVSVETKNLPANGNPPGKWERELNGRNINLSIVYKDEHVAIYSPRFEMYPLESLRSISEMWKQTKDKYYGPADQQLLYIALQDGTADDSCTSSSNNSDSNADTVPIIDCLTTITTDVRGSHFGPLLEEQIAAQIASLPLKGRKSTGVGVGAGTGNGPEPGSAIEETPPPAPTSCTIIIIPTKIEWFSSVLSELWKFFVGS